MELTELQDSDFQALSRLRVEQCEHDFQKFCYAYFPQYFYDEPSVMHTELFAQLQEAIDNNRPDDVVDAAPRGFAKSTIVSFALAIWCAVYRKKHYILLVSDTSDQASDFLGNIRNEFEDNGLLIDDFGFQEGTVWTTTDIITAFDVRIQSVGSGKRVRGRRYKQYRPDLIICDDLENDENVQSPDQRKKDFSWFSKALSKVGDRTTDKIVIGTILHYDSLLSKLLVNPTYKTKIYRAIISWSQSALWLDWEKLITNLADPDRMNTARKFFDRHEQEMLKGTEVLWQSRWSYYNLMVIRVADGPASFSSELQNEPLSDEDRRFSPEWIAYYEDEEIKDKELFIVTFIDPSMGKKGSDYSAIITLGMDELYQIYVLEADLQRRHPDLIITDGIGHLRKWRSKIIGVEENQFQEYFKDNFIKKMTEEELSKEGISTQVRGIRQIADKILRIESLQPDIKNARVKFKKDQQLLIEQLVNFPSAANDDGPDALEGAITLLGKKSAIGEYYKAQANESTQSNRNSFLKDPSIQGIIRTLQQQAGSGNS